MAELVTKYQQYAEYKDSGVEWLDKVPSHWQPIAIKYLALEENTLFLDGDWIESKDISEEGIRYITTGNVGEGRYKEQGTGFITEEVFEKLNCSEVFENDILISRLNMPIGRACLVPNLNNKVVTSVDNVILRPDKAYSKNFLVYLFTSSEYFRHTANLSRGATMQRISRGLLGNIRISLPQKDEQTRIANFLDHETAQIDTLIEKQQTLIALLKEKRQAVISHAVTKGLNPDAPMKDSGVEWLGDVPEHWVVSPLKFYIDTRKGVAFKSVDFTDLGVKVVKASDIKEKTIRQSDVFLPVYFSETYPKAILSEGDIVISTVGSTPDVKNSAVGQIGMVPVELDGSLLNQNTVVFTPRNNMLENLFLFYLIQTGVYRDHLDLNAHGTANQASLNVSDMLNFTFARPSLKEQSEISEYIIEVNSNFDALEKNCLTAIQLMQERRTALISAAVTGKIDVRGWQASA